MVCLKTSPEKLTHLDSAGRAQMVDVGAKPVVPREAEAQGWVVMQPSTLRAIVQGRVPKGEVFNTARIAGIMAAKRCGELIPLCHPLPIESVTVNFELPPDLEAALGSSGEVRVRVVAVARVTARTGIEMEALTAVSVAGLTIYDMCKAIDKTMRIDGVSVTRKVKGEPG